MTFTADPIATTTAAVIASILMVIAGTGAKRLRWRCVYCPVCHNPRESCACRWL